MLSFSYENTAYTIELEKKAMIRNRYTYLSPFVQDTIGKERRT